MSDMSIIKEKWYELRNRVVLYFKSVKKERTRNQLAKDGVFFVFKSILFIISNFIPVPLSFLLILDYKWKRKFNKYSVVSGYVGKESKKQLKKIVKNEIELR